MTAPAIGESRIPASDTYRKLMLALAEYCRPPKPVRVHARAYEKAYFAQK